MKLLDEYDLIKLNKARKLLYEVWEYNYGAPRTSRIEKKLNTVISKLDTIIIEGGNENE